MFFGINELVETKIYVMSLTQVYFFKLSEGVVFFSFNRKKCNVYCCNFKNSDKNYVKEGRNSEYESIFFETRPFNHYFRNKIELLNDLLHYITC